MKIYRIAETHLHNLSRVALIMAANSYKLVPKHKSHRGEHIFAKSSLPRGWMRRRLPQWYVSLPSGANVHDRDGVVATR